MAGKQRRQKSMRENPAAKVILVVFAVFMLFSLVIYANDVIFKFDFIPSADDIISWLNGKSNAVTVADGEIAVHFIDVEQGDCELIVSGDKTVLIDCGANAECTPEYLVQFAYLGSFYAQQVLGLARPRVGLLNIGAEDSKGTDLQKQTLARLKEADAAGHLHFIGNIEAKEAIKGGCDVIVTDGFSGNILLKTMEGVGSFAGSALKGMFKKNLLTKLAALAVMPGLNAFKDKLDPNKVGGTAFIGISKAVIKAHGASNAEAVENAVGQAAAFARSGLIEKIEENVNLMKIEQ